MGKDLSIIIVNYNGKKFLKNCFDSITKHCAFISFEILVVDNNSSDGSCSYIEEYFPNIKLIKNNQNLGFAKANNLGVKHGKGKYILLLNNDTILLNDLKPALDLMKGDNSIGVLGAKMLDKDKNYLTSVGRFPNPFNVVKFSFLEDKRPAFIKGDFIEDQYSVDWLSGAFILISKKLYTQVDGLDEDYFMYVEDVDFCKKISNLNKKIIFLPNISYIHFVGFSIKREQKLIDGYRIYVKKHMSLFGKKIAKLMLAFNLLYKKTVYKI